ncbi:hypothetical protein U1Q18_024322, partial [Sarracenia purpurea var. burkii]
MYSGLIRGLLTHPYQTSVGVEGMNIIPYEADHKLHHLQGMVMVGPQLNIQNQVSNPLYHRHLLQVHEAPPPPPAHPLICMTNDIKPRLRWTPELHACFVDAVNQLGGPF